MATSTPTAPGAVRAQCRHLSLAELGVEGLRKLLGGGVLLIGAGGLGCPVTVDPEAPRY